MNLKEKKEALAEKEWQNFQKVHNEGGRAFCQDDPETFFIMRRSQFSPWNKELTESWLADLTNGENMGRNLLAEKYAWMMRQTAPEKFDEIKANLVFPNFFADRIIEEIIKLEVNWMEEYKNKYPFLADGNRPIYSYQDNEYNTSFETYLRGELYTYSDKTLNLYYSMVLDIKNKGKNLAIMIIENMVKQYGFTNINQAEQQEKLKAEKLL